MAFESYNIVCFIKNIELGMKEKIKKGWKIGQKEVLKYFWKVSMTEKFLFFVIIFCIIGASIWALLTPLYFSKIIDVISSFAWWNRDDTVNQLMRILWTIALIEVWRLTFRRGFGFSLVKMEILNVQKLFKRAFEHLHKHSYEFFTNSFGWALVKKVNKFAYSYENIMDLFTMNFLRIMILLPAIIVTVFIKNTSLGIIFLWFVIIFIIINFVLYKLNIKYEIESNERDSEITWVLADSITNNFNILSFASLNWEIGYFNNTLKKWRKATFKKWNRWEVILTISTVLLVLFLLCTLFFSIKLRGNGAISTGTIVLVQLYMIRIMDQLFMVWYTFKKWNRAIWESAEMLEILHKPHDIQDDKNAIDLIINSGKIELQNVWFSYNKWDDIFKDLNLKIQPWEKVAFVWESGAGKTSIIKLMMRFFDIQKGKILIDWQNISKVTQDSLRDSISIVPQDPILFHRTLRENISYGKPNASEKEIIAVSKMARCHEFVMKLEDGYDTLVWERWIKLSWWERQRVAIARAILENKSILLLDEATSALDSESEMLIQEAMQEVMRWKTTIIVAHRLSTIMNVDKIIVMDNGNIVEKWSHKELLLKKDGIYKNFRDIQSGGFKW